MTSTRINETRFTFVYWVHLPFKIQYHHLGLLSGERVSGAGGGAGTTVRAASPQEFVTTKLPELRGGASEPERISSKILAVRRVEVISLCHSCSLDVQHNTLSVKCQNLHSCAILPRLSRRLGLLELSFLSQSYLCLEGLDCVSAVSTLRSVSFFFSLTRCPVSSPFSIHLI